MIGHGAVGSYVAERLADVPGLSVRWALVRPGREDRARACFGPDVIPIGAVDDLDGQPDVALECASHAAVAEHGPAVLRRGIDLGIVSTGALSALGLAESLEIAANEGGARLSILAGAIGAVDALAAAREGGLEEVGLVKLDRDKQAEKTRQEFEAKPGAKDTRSANLYKQSIEKCQKVIDKYRSPVSQSIVTTRDSGPRCFATSIAAQTFAPADTPTSKPSSRVSRLAMVSASSSVTLITSS